MTQDKFGQHGRFHSDKIPWYLDLSPFAAIAHKCSIAFHRWTDDSICVGGNPANTDTTLIVDIKIAIKAALEKENSDIVVNSPTCPRKFNGDRPENIVNRLGTNGVQVEQCMKARRDHHESMSEAVVKVIRTRINDGIHSTKI